MEKEGFKNKSDYLIYLKCGDLCGHFMALVSKKYLILKNHQEYLFMRMENNYGKSISNRSWSW